MAKITELSNFKKLGERFERELIAEETFINSIKKNGLDFSEKIESIFSESIIDRVHYFHKNDIITEFYKQNKDLKRLDLIFLICQLIVSKDFEPNLSRLEKLNLGIISTLAIMVEGVSSSPEEGFLKAEEIKESDKIFIRLVFGPAIRGAGGTAQGAIVIIADWLRRQFNYDEYPTLDEEISRYTTEILAYAKIHPRQRMPTTDELAFIMKNLPVFIDGNPSEIEEVPSYKFIKRVKTAQLRGGVCLIITEGLLLKWKKLKDYYVKFNLIEEWKWLDQLAPLIITETNLENSEPKYLKSIIAGRPLFSMTNTPGHLRVVIGRSLNTGLGCAGLNPVTAKFSKFINTGTQFISDFPGKALSVAVVDSLAPPTVKLKNGSVIRLDTLEILEKNQKNIVKILDYGEISIAIGDFNQNKMKIPPFETSNEIFEYECKKNGVIPDFLIENEDTCFENCKKYNITPPPIVTPLTGGGSITDFLNIQNCTDYDNVNELIKKSLENFAILHSAILKENKKYSIKFKYPKFFNEFKAIPYTPEKDLCEMITKNSKYFKNKGAFTVGLRMGRAEGASQTKTDPAVHWLIYSNDILANKYSLKKWFKDYKCIIKMNHVVFRCKICESIVITPVHCNIRTERVAFYKTKENGRFKENYITYEENKILKILTDKEFLFNTKKVEIDIKQRVNSSLRIINNILDQDIKIGAGTNQRNLFIESFTKGFLRAKYNLFCARDSTVRYTFSNAILTHASCKMLNISVDQIKKLDYTTDIYQKNIINENQIFELFPQDIVINFESANYFVKATKYLDELLETDYNSEAYYACKSIYDLLGHKFIGISPHTCIGIACRVIGFSNSNVLFGHYIFHAAKRRNADGDGDNLLLYLDCLLNFSYAYLKRGAGAKMNVPIFISRILDYNEIDDEANSVDNDSEFTDKLIKTPNESYKNFKSMCKSKDKFTFSIKTTQIDCFDQENAYKDVQQMEEKIELQLDFLKLLRNTDVQSVVSKVISNHLLPDIIGCSRTFLRQNLKCEKCFVKFEYPPLRGKCSLCNSNLRMTIYPNSVKKYVTLIEKLRKKYKIDVFLNSKIEIVMTSLNTIFYEKANTLKELFF